MGMEICEGVGGASGWKSRRMEKGMGKNCRYGMEWTVWRLWHAEFRETNCG